MTLVAEPATTVTVPEVSRGAVWLDENVPGWWKRIDLESLDLGECELCVSGQLALEDTLEGQFGTGYPIQLGMETPEFATYGDSYRELRVAWEAEILRRREVAC